MRAILTICWVLLLAGCAAPGQVVRCDGRLEPINTLTIESPREQMNVPRAEASMSAGEERE